MINFAHQFFRRSVAGACLFIAAGTATAQEGPDAQDLRALRYYIAQDENAAVAAELRRLEIAFPDWTPPDDLSALERTAPTTEIDSIYALIARDDLAGARRELATTRSAFPDWVPPAEMLTLLASADAQTMFDAAIAARNPGAALQVAVDEPALLRCNRINNVWRLAELEEQTGERAAALAAYRQIVGACSSTSDVVATIEKADSVASEDDLRALIAMARQRIPASDSTFEALLNRLLAGRESAVPAAPTAPTTSPPPATPTATPATPRPTAQPTPAAAPPAPAASRAAPATPSAPPAAVAVVSAGVSPLTGLRSSGDGRLSQVRASAQAGDFRACTAQSMSPRSLDVAYERAWCVYNLERPLEALALFTAAASGLGGMVPRDARYGMALSMLKRNMTDTASQIAASTDFTLEQRRTIEAIILDQRGVRAYQQEDYKQAIIYFDGLEALDGTLRRDLSILRAYAYLNSGDRTTARALFQRLHDALATEETRAGLAAARG